MSNRAYPGFNVPADTCGKEIGEGVYCGRPAAYHIRFAGWPSYYLAGACAEHAAAARELNVERIWSVAS